MKQKGFNLGPPDQTRDHHYRRFFSALMFTLGIAVAMGWAYYQGYIDEMVKSMGVGFTIFFALLLVSGIGASLREAFQASREINEIKQIGDDVGKLKEYFHIKKLNSLAFQYVCRQVEREVDRRLSGLLFIYELSFNVGFFGTLVGILIGLAPLAALMIYTQETLAPKMPAFFTGMLFAFWTAIAGLAVAIVTRCMFYLLWKSTAMLQSRVERAFYNAMSESE